MSKGRICNKAYWEMEAGLSKEPCFFVYNGECLKDIDMPCPMPPKPKKKTDKKL